MLMSIHVIMSMVTNKPTKKMYSLRLDPDLDRLLKALKERDGIPESEQIRRALRLWFESKGMVKKSNAKSKGDVR